MTFAAVCVFLILCASLTLVDGAISCTPKTEPAPVSTEILDPEIFLTFTEAAGYDGNPKIVSPVGSPVEVILTGPNCYVNQGFGLEDYMWTNMAKWYPDNDESPTFFFAVNAQTNGYCELTFSETISYFSIRTAGSTTPSGIFIYDEADQELNCNLIPWLGAEGHNNAYVIRGFSSASKNIKKIRVKDSYSAADLLRANKCSPGRTLVGNDCLLPCEMDPAPCGSNTDCTNVGNTAECACKTHYTGNATEGCVPMTCTYSADSCNQYATCSDEVSEPFYSCACNEGYEGDGYGVDGCTAIPIAPIAPPLTAPVSAPQASAPTSEPVSEPSADPVSSPDTTAPVESEPTTGAPVTTPRTKVSAAAMHHLVDLTVTILVALIILH